MNCDVFGANPKDGWFSLPAPAAAVHRWGYGFVAGAMLTD